VRLPLSELTVAVTEPESLRAYSDLLADELNVKQVTVVAATEEVASSFGLTKSLVVYEVIKQNWTIKDKRQFTKVMTEVLTEILMGEM
jgi:hypothetical protein